MIDKNIVLVRRIFSAAEARARFAQQYPLHSDADPYTQPGKQNIVYRDADTGKFIACLINKCFTREQIATRYAAWHKINGDPRNRAAIYPEGARMPGINKDGTQTNFNRVPKEIVGEAKSERFGMTRYKGQGDGVVRCGPTSATAAKPGAYLAAYRAALPVVEIFHAVLPREFKTQQKYVDSVLPHLKMPFTPWCEMYGLHNAPTAYHLDDFNDPTGIGVMTTCGVWEGNDLCIAEYGLRFNVQPTDLLLFDVVSLWHGNLQQKSGKRWSQIYFCRIGMHKCSDDSGGKMVTAADIAAEEEERL